MENPDSASIYSKHIVYQPHLILYSKKLITISTFSLIIDSLPIKPELREIISYSDIEDIIIHKNNPRDFTLRSLKSNFPSLKLTSYDRMRLLSDLYKAMDLFNFIHNKNEYGNNEQIKKPKEFLLNLDCFHDELTYSSIKLIIFRSFLRFFYLEKKSNEPQFKSSDPEVTKSGLEGKEQDIYFIDVEEISKNSNNFTLHLKSKILIKFHCQENIGNIAIEIAENYEQITFSKLNMKQEDVEGELKKKAIVDTLISQYFLILTYRMSPLEDLMKKIILGCNETELLEFDIHKKKLLFHINLNDIEFIIRKSWGLQMVTTEKAILNYVISSEKRDIIINNLLYLKDKANETTLLSAPLSLNLKTYGSYYCEMDADVQLDILKKIKNIQTESEFEDFLNEFILHCNMKGVKELNATNFQHFLQKVNKKLTLYFQPEMQTFVEIYTDYQYYSYLKSELMLKGDPEEKNLLENKQNSEQRMENFLSENNKIIWENYQEIKLTIEWLENFISQLERSLCVLCIMSNCSTYFRDISNDKEEFYSNIFFLLVNLNDSHNETLSYFSSYFIQKILVTDFFLDKKLNFETKNRSLLINGKPKLLNKICESLAYKTLFGSLNQESHYALSIKLTLKMIEILFIENKDGNDAKDLEYLYEILTSRIMITVLANLCRCESFSLLHSASVILNAIFEVSLGNKKNVKNIQSLFMNYTCLTIVHMFLGLAHVSEKQRKVSIIFFSYMLNENQAACSLLIRLVPKCLLSRVNIF